MPNKISKIHQSIDNLIDEVHNLAKNMSRLVKNSPTTALHGLNTIDNCIQVVNETIRRLIPEE